MAHLTLTGVSEDGKRLLLADDSGAEHSLDIDQRLRTALREPSRRMEKQMDSTLRPRDIQARIRAGESAEEVAAAAQTSVDKIMAFAGPVLAEREHVADRAQRSSVRRRAGETAGTARTLGEAVETHLRALHISAELVEWDAWRRDDGRWSLVGHYETPGRSGTAELTYDLPGNFVVLDNDDARWLVGEHVDEPEPLRDDLQVRRQRLTTVDPVDQELPLGDDAIELVRGDQPVESFLDEQPATDPAVVATEAELVEEAGDAAALDQAGEPPADAQPDTEPDAESDVQPETAAPADVEPEPEPRVEEPPRRAVRKSRGRASVPSWDEIMFGGGKQD